MGNWWIRCQWDYLAKRKAKRTAEFYGKQELEICKISADRFVKDS